MTYKAIDFRVRPRVPGALQSHQPGRVSPVFAKNATQFKALDRFTPQPIGETIAEMREAGIVHAVIAAADSETLGGAKIANELIADLVRAHPDTLTGYVGVDPRKGMAAVRELEHAVRELGLRGLSTDPFINQLLPTDAQYYPLYAKAVELGIPVFSHCSVNFDSRVVMDYGHPRHLDQVACHFPELTIIARHGGWPWVLDMVAVAWRHENVYVEISGISPKYLHRDLLTYADGLLRHKFLFGTSYPLQPFKRAVEEFLALPLRDETKRAILYDNAAKLLHLADASKI